MIHTLLYAVLWLLSLFIVFELGRAYEIVGEIDRILDGREPLAGSVDSPADDGAAHPSPGYAAPSRSSSIYDGEAEAALDPRPVLTVVEEPPGLRVVEP